MAKDDGYEFRRTLLKREILPARNEKEEVGPFRRHIVKHDRLGHTRHEPLHRPKDWEPLGSCEVWRMMLRAMASLQTRSWLASRIQWLFAPQSAEQKRANWEQQ